jgi:hypothetical protein
MTEDLFFVRPQSNQRIAVGKRDLGNPAEKLYIGVPKIGLVISTFAAVPYVDVALAVRQRLYPEVPVLVHDDASDQTEALVAVCQAAGATFETNSSRLGHELGDLSSIVGGLRWAKEMGLDLLVKMSRRFVPNTNWAPKLAHMAQVTQFATFARNCGTHDFPLRSECFAMGVGPWSSDEIDGRMTAFLLNNHEPFSVEQLMFDLAGKVYAGNCVAARQWELNHVRANPKLPFVMWDFLSEGRRTPTKAHLWHEISPPEQYAELARVVGKNYPPQAFAGYFSQAGV